MNGRRVIIVMALLMAALVIGVTVTAYFSVRDRVQRKWAASPASWSDDRQRHAARTLPRQTD